VDRLFKRSRDASSSGSAEPEVRNILGAGVLERLLASVFMVCDKAGAPTGTGFFVSKDLAVTAAHSFNAIRKNMKVHAIFGEPHATQTADFTVMAYDNTLDYVVLSVKNVSFGHAYLPLSDRALHQSDECVLAAVPIDLGPFLQDIASHLRVYTHRGTVTATHTRHFVYDCASYGGESGGAVVLSNGKVIGMHLETVNQCRERLGHAKDVDARLNDVELSVDSLLRGTASGAIALNGAVLVKVLCSALPSSSPFASSASSSSS